MDVVHLKISNLGVVLTPTVSHIRFSIPKCHKKFLLPADNPQQFQYSDSINNEILMLHAYQALNINQNPPGDLLYGSESWQLHRDQSSTYTFRSLNQNPPFTIRINADFSQGIILGDFENATNQNHYPLEFIDMRIFSAWLGSLGDLILHASGFIHDGKGYCFVGHSGVGKSTIIRKFASLQENLTIIGEDQVVLRYIDDKFWVFGTPWHLDCEMCNSDGAPLEKVFFLSCEGVPRLTKCKPVEGVSRILETAVIPYYNPDWVTNILNHLGLLAENIPFFTIKYHLESNPWSRIINA